MLRNLGLALVALAAPACGEDPVSHYGQVGLQLALASAEVSGGRVGDEQQVGAASGDPYGAFMAAARGALGGEPGGMEIDMLRLRVIGGGVRLGAIYDGPTTVTFAMNGTGTIVPVATLDIEPTTGPGPSPMIVGFDAGTVTGDDWTALLGGDFAVVLDGPAAATFEGAGASVGLEALFTFQAIE
jgi:hypothetical protein